MKTLNFNTQIATTIEQSNRLLELGLDPNTADMSIVTKPASMDGPFLRLGSYKDMRYKDTYGIIPAWSLHRLITMLPLKIEDDYSQESFLKIEGSNIVYKERDIYIYNSFEKNNIYDNIIDCIEWLIKNSHFNKDYLK